MQETFPRKFGPYTLLKSLGEGGMGRVYLGMTGQAGLETLCVVKRLLPGLVSQPDYARRFLHEVDLARRLMHGNLAHTHSVGEVDGELYLVQQFVEGQDLSRFMERMAASGRKLSIELSVYIASEIARGLAYAHAFENLNLIHRDINPPNIRLSYAGEVKILDFGVALSKLQDSESGRHLAAGKLWYLAPEQFMPDQHVEQRSDLYALGVLLWEMLTHVPFGTARKNGKQGRVAETEAEVMTYIALGDFSAPSQWNPKVTPKLDTVVLRLLKPDPNERYATADDVRDALIPFLPSGGHPDRTLAAELLAVFSPDTERAERLRLMEIGRPLLNLPDPEEKAKAPTGTQATAERSRTEEGDPVPWREGRRRSRSRSRISARLFLLISIGGGSLLGLCVLVFLLYRQESHRQDLNRGGSPAAGAPVLAIPTRPEAILPTAMEKSAATVPKPKSVTKEKAARTSTPKKNGHAPTRRTSVQEDHFTLARDAFNHRDYEGALVHGQKAVAAGGGAEAHALLGNVYVKMGKLAQAAVAYQAALELDAGNELYRRRLKIVTQERDGNAP